MLELKKSRASIRSIRSSDTRNDSIRSQNPSYQQRKSPLEREDDLTLRREASPERERDTRRAAGAELVRASSLRFLFFSGQISFAAMRRTGHVPLVAYWAVKVVRPVISYGPNCVGCPIIRPRTFRMVSGPCLSKPTRF
jgi:hypothetical protein